MPPAQSPMDWWATTLETLPIPPRPSEYYLVLTTGGKQELCGVLSSIITTIRAIRNTIMSLHKRCSRRLDLIGTTWCHCIKRTKEMTTKLFGASQQCQPQRRTIHSPQLGTILGYNLQKIFGIHKSDAGIIHRAMEGWSGRFSNSTMDTIIRTQSRMVHSSSSLQDLLDLLAIRHTWPGLRNPTTGLSTLD